MRPRKGRIVVDADGNEYPRCYAAARAMGYDQSTIRHHLNKYGNLDLLGSGKVPVVKDGVHYDSIAEFSRATGASMHSAQRHLAVYGTLDGLRIGRGGTPGNRAKSTETTIGPMTWPTRKAAAQDLGLSKVSLRRYLKPTATAQQKDVLMARLMAAHQRHLAAQGAA